MVTSSKNKPPAVAASQPFIWDDSTVWTPALFDQAMQSADAGNLRMAADMCDDMLADDRISAVVNTRINGLLGCDIEFEADSARVRKAAEKDWYRFANESVMREHLAWAILLGVSVANTPWHEVDGRWVPEIKVWHPRSLSYDWVRDTWFVHDKTGVRIDIPLDSADWWVYTPYGAHRPWGKGTWRATAMYWLGKNQAWRDWQRHNEIHGSGIIAGRIPEGKSVTDSGSIAFFNQIKAIGKKARVLLPFGYNLETIEAKSNTWTTFPEAIKHANTAIAITHLGQNLTTEVDGGSYAATVAHGTVRHDYLRFDSQCLSTAVHDGILAHWARFNFGEEAKPPWVEWRIEPPEDLKLRAETLGIAADALTKLKQAGLDVDTDEFAEEFDIDLKPVSVMSEMVTLASGHTDNADGFIEGQEYIDKLTASAIDAGVRALNPEIDKILEIIDDLDDTPDWPKQLRAKLVDAYGNLDSKSFCSVVEKALVLAQLAGRHAVLVDADE